MVIEENDRLTGESNGGSPTYSRPASPSNFYVTFTPLEEALLGDNRRSHDLGYYSEDDPRDPSIHNHHGKGKPPRRNWISKLFEKNKPN